MGAVGCYLVYSYARGDVVLNVLVLVAVREDAVLCCTWVSIVYILATVVLP